MRERAFDSRSRSTARPRPSPSAVPSSVRSFTISSDARDGDQVVVVEGERAARVGVAGEADEADGVVGPTGQAVLAAHEVVEHVHDRLQPGPLRLRGRQIEGAHRAGDVDDHHDGDALAPHRAAPVRHARPGHRHRHGDDRQRQQRGRHEAGAGAPAAPRRQQAQRREGKPPGRPPRPHVERNGGERGQQEPRLAQLDRRDQAGDQIDHDATSAAAAGARPRAGRGPGARSARPSPPRSPRRGAAPGRGPPATRRRPARSRRT